MFCYSLESQFEEAAAVHFIGQHQDHVVYTLQLELFSILFTFPILLLSPHSVPIPILLFPF